MNLHGTKKLVDFILKLEKPPEVIYRISKKFFRRLIDANSFVAIEETLHLDLHKQHIGSQYLIIAIAHELLDVRRIPGPQGNADMLRFARFKSYSNCKTCVFLQGHNPVRNCVVHRSVCCK